MFLYRRREDWWFRSRGSCGDCCCCCGGWCRVWRWQWSRRGVRRQRGRRWEQPLKERYERKKEKNHQSWRREEEREILALGWARLTITYGQTLWPNTFTILLLICSTIWIPYSLPFSNYILSPIAHFFLYITNNKRICKRTTNTISSKNLFTPNNICD